jgi:hypothetical protein
MDTEYLHRIYPLYPSLSLFIPLYPSLSLFIPLYPSLSFFIPLYPSFSLFDYFASTSNRRHHEPKGRVWGTQKWCGDVSDVSVVLVVSDVCFVLLFWFAVRCLCLVNRFLPFFTCIVTLCNTLGPLGVRITSVAFMWLGRRRFPP